MKFKKDKIYKFEFSIKFKAAMSVVMAVVCIFGQNFGSVVYAGEQGEVSYQKVHEKQQWGIHESSGGSRPENLNDEISEKRYETLIAHGAGSVDGIKTTSSVEALERAAANGFKMIELDMVFTKDGKIVMLHDWDRTTVNYLGEKINGAMNLKEFENRRIAGKFQPLTMEKLALFLKKHQDIKIVTDIKDDNVKMLEHIAENYPHIFNQIIPQIYDYDEYEPVKKLGYRDIIFTLYALEAVDVEKVRRFAKEQGLYAVTVPYNFYTKGIPETLSQSGIKVYTHPIETFEDAKRELQRGAVGVYTSDLLPEEFQGAGQEYYLMQTNDKGQLVRLTDTEIKAEDIRLVRIHGDFVHKALRYKLDGEQLESRLKNTEDSGTEKHTLTVEIWNTEKKPMTLHHTMIYVLTKNNGKVRILDKKLAYRVEQLKEIPKFEDVFSKEAGSEEVKLLEEALVASSNHSYYYFNGEGRHFYTGDELLKVEKNKNGNIMVPFAEAGRILGIDDISLGRRQYIYINENQDKYVSKLYTKYIQKNSMNIVLNEPMTLSRSKAMASGEVFRAILGCEFVQSESVILILPKGVEATSNQKKIMLKMAERLYKESEV